MFFRHLTMNGRFDWVGPHRLPDEQQKSPSNLPLALEYHNIRGFCFDVSSWTMTTRDLVLSRRLRMTPYEKQVAENGAHRYTVYNKTPLAATFITQEEDYAHLCEYVQIWDVACERQVEVVGADALALVELLTPRDIARCRIKQCVYAPLVDEFGGIVNDPIILRLAEDRFWLSLADSDVLLWVKGIAYGRGMDVSVFEPDVYPLAIQGPLADDLMSDVVGQHARDIGFFRFVETEIANTPVILARSGWSGQGGFEVYLQDFNKGLELWDTFFEAGQKYNIRVGTPNQIERLETGLLSYGSDMTLANNPLECGFDRFFSLGKTAEYMSRDALDQFASQGINKKLVRLAIDGDVVRGLRSTWDVKDEQGKKVGIVTSQAYSTKFASTLAIATVDIAYSEVGQQLWVDIDGQEQRAAQIRNLKWGLD